MKKRDSIKVVIVDDHPTFRKGLIVQLNEIPDLKVIGEASTGKEFIDCYMQLSPDIVFMDISMPETNGIDATRMAISINSSIKIIAISSYCEEEFLQGMLDAGAKGFLLKNVDTEDIAKAIKTVMQGKNYFSLEMLSILTTKFINKPVESDVDPKALFSKKELNILQLICEGFTNNEIGKQLFLSPRTIDGHRANMISKVTAKNTIGLVIYAFKNKLVSI